MRFTVSQEALAQALLVVTKGMATNSTLPILSGILLHADAGVLELQTTNLNISIRHRIAANVEEGGAVVVSGKIVNNIVKTLPDAAISFVDEDRQVKITCGKSTFRLNTLAVSDFPNFPQYDLDRTVELPSNLLGEMVDKVYKVTSKDTSRPILSGVLLNVENNTIRLVATDSYRLAVCDTHSDTPDLTEQFSAIVPGATFHEVLALPTMTETIVIGTTDSQVVFTFGNTTYISRKIEGNFPNYRQLLPTAFNTSVQLDVASFAAALKRVSVVALANPSVRLDIDTDGALIRLSASSPDQGDSSELIDAEIEGDSMPIAVNYHYALDCVNAMSGVSEMTMELQGSLQPAIFKAYSEINFLYLLMPVRL